LVQNLAGLRPFGHPPHGDIFATLRVLETIGDPLATCGAGAWSVERPGMYRNYIRVVDG
jgi:hypothetical protein